MEYKRCSSCIPGSGALTGLLEPHPEHLASSQPVCIACGSSDLSLAHRYWSCSSREVFSLIGRTYSPGSFCWSREPCHHHPFSG
ncbi:hypothetical protein LAZ67_11002872 [Cordylochernes scorpioides]|uniref:Uncharacterized protein n=1 Tax=Cordylochernes scorpioides TaxID=51811 RepID=A0ABY6L1B6_9ARAC|nr:hypothetical protein LAZ67_11002872 [Cordylochernes scorpioides]